MPELLPVAAALTLGFFGSVHCVGMCGGIVGVLTYNLPPEVRHAPNRLLPYAVAYNGGRILSYMAAGAIAGLVGAAALSPLDFERAITIGRGLAGAFMILLGFYVAGWSPVLSRLEQLGAKLWRRIEPFGRRFIPVHHPAQALALGIVWGWLPCGMVYSALTLALATASVPAGAVVMGAFGLGTLPMLLAMGLGASTFLQLAQRPALRKVAGLLIIAAGVYLFFAPTVGHGDHVHHVHTVCDIAFICALTG